MPQSSLPMMMATYLLLDTHTLIWLGLGDPRLPERLRMRFSEETCYVSEISRCEIVIKEQARQRSLGLDFDALIERAGFHRLPLGNGVHRRLKTLPMIHRDPFDRILIAQALASNLSLVSRDATIRRYDVPVVW